MLRSQVWLTSYDYKWGFSCSLGQKNIFVITRNPHTPKTTVAESHNSLAAKTTNGNKKASNNPTIVSPARPTPSQDFDHLADRAKYDDRIKVDLLRKRLCRRITGVIDNQINFPATDDFSGWSDMNEPSANQLLPDVGPSDTGDPMDLSRIKLSSVVHKFRINNGLCVACGQNGHVAKDHHHKINPLPMPKRSTTQWLSCEGQNYHQPSTLTPNFPHCLKNSTIISQSLPMSMIYYHPMQYFPQFNTQLSHQSSQYSQPSYSQASTQSRLRANLELEESFKSESSADGYNWYEDEDGSILAILMDNSNLELCSISTSNSMLLRSSLSNLRIKKQVIFSTTSLIDSGCIAMAFADKDSIVNQFGIETKPLHTPQSDRLADGSTEASITHYFTFRFHVGQHSEILVFFVTTLTGGIRLCQYFRDLKNVIIKNRYPLPLIREIFDSISSARYYTKLDVIAAFNRIRIAEGHEWMTTFTTRFGLYEMLVTPSGLCNAPATFQNYINHISNDAFDKYCTAYLDDVLIYSETKEEHAKHVDEVIRRLSDAGLQIAIAKSEFYTTKTRYLGMIFSTDGLSMDPDKAILDWKEPSTVKELQKFLGFSNFY
ncbi:hypothetical protein EPUL_005043 [Erysiphe pulchra]|uniref:Reverse transcriptase domain-containing protein n=1 Tax=Erysiphe pulchra TaxID=225359 RepID=A0A2S4PNY4_9PEZI|nr:hypothetical protein EPUL_005043 [Erysiphe pulchra]